MYLVWTQICPTLLGWTGWLSVSLNLLLWLNGSKSLKTQSNICCKKEKKWKLLGQEIDGLSVLYFLVLFCFLLAPYPLIKTHSFHLASLKSEIHHLWHIQCMCEVTTTRLPHEAWIKLNLVVVNSMAFISDWVHKNLLMFCAPFYTRIIIHTYTSIH